MKKKTNFTYLIGVFTLVSMIGITLARGSIDGIKDTRANFTYDCDFYFDQENGYTSLFEINNALYNGVTLETYKTWGTVTIVSRDSSNNFNFYIQSTDRNGDVGSMYVYQSNRSDIVTGNVLTITGVAELYNNLPEFIDPVIAVDLAVNDSPVTTLVTGASFWQNSTYPSSDEFLAAQLMGPRQVRINNVIISHVSSGNATILIEGTTLISVFYGNLSNTAAIASRISAISDSYIDIIGYVNAYRSNGTSRLQLLLRDTRDLIGGAEVENTLQMNSNTYYNVGSYSTGNYGQGSVDGIGFEHYRVTKPSGQFLALLPYNSGVNDTSVAGAFYNVDPIYDIDKIEITYYTELVSGESPTLNYGVSRAAMITYDLPLSSTSHKETLTMDEINYFSIETTESRLYITSISVFYSDTPSGTEFTYGPANGDHFRINPVVYEGTPTNGSTVEVPTLVVKKGNTYEVLATKVYTYYTFDYISTNPGLASQAAYTEPEDLAAYYTAFKTWPANYVVKSSYYSARSLFDDDARCVSTYSRTDGYALSVPYKNGEQNKPLYHELDVALDSSYSSNSRGVGRVVVWEYGFDSSRGAVGYDNAPTAVYTDDHYATFQEYLNTGIYGDRFNSEMNRTIYVWGGAETIF